MTPTIVTRPDPPRDEPDAPAAKKAPPKMTKEEVAALLAVSTTNQAPGSNVGSRAKRAALPVLVLSVLLGYTLGTIASLVPVVLGIAYSAWPLVTQKKDGWS